MAATLNIHQLLGGMAKFEASDLHLKVGYPPYYRVAGALRKIEAEPIAATEQIEQMLLPLAPETRRKQYEELGDLDFSWQDEVGDRFRINIFRASTQMHAAIRRVKSYIPSFEELHLPPIYEKTIARNLEGFILVCGVTGSGKSTTLAALLEHVNQNRHQHIITIEDPIEYTFRPKSSIISQREIGIDIPNYAEALKYMVRQDPDTIFIGEMRDQNTMMAALQAAETGHLVFGSLHCADAAQSFTRILEFFPHSQHAFIRSSLATSLVAIMAQRLLPAEDPKISRVPATEVLLSNPALKDKIRNEEDEDIPDIITSSTEEGMRNFTMSLAELVEQEYVAMDVAREYAPNREALDSAVRGIKTAAQSLVSRVRHRQ